MRQSSVVRRPLLLLSCALLLGAAPSRPQRIVSLNLCADQYLLALADPGQIAGLTVLARDPTISAEAARAGSFAITKGAAEDVLALRPDLLIASPGRRRETMARLRDHHLATLDLSPADSYEEVVAQIRSVASAIGQRARGETLIARMNARLARLPRSAGRGRVAAYYQRRGFLTGTDTLIDDLMSRVGLVNLAARRPDAKLSRVTLEQMVVAKPDYLIVETATDRIVDQGTELLHHPALATIRRLRLPQAWTVCGGPAYVLAAESLSHQLTRVGTR